MNEGPRRRRLRETAPPETKNTFPLFPLFLVVILLGLGLGYLFSRVFAAPHKTVAQTTATVAAPTPEPVATETPSPLATQSAAPAPSLAASPAPRATPHRVTLSSPAPKPVIKVTPSPSPGATATVSPKPAPPTAAPRAPETPKPATPKPATPRPKAQITATPVAMGGPAGQLARSYLDAVINGDPVSANRALGRAPDNGDFPEKAMLTRGSHVTSVHTTNNDDGSYKVEAEVDGPSGTVFCTFQTARSDIGGLYLSDHECIKVR
ncbi:MAG: hypothetical protein M3126_06380 [Candidatus Eremiobacteraeota bacterium]|nr:hypothetical protein [Candidatus Eremiobacteraeota bacterium]